MTVKFGLAIATAMMLSACAGPAAGPEALAVVDSAKKKASTAQAGVQIVPQQLDMPGLDRKRTLRIYLPPGYHQTSDRFPVLYMHDGQNLFDDATSYVGEWGVDETLDELAISHGLRIIVVGIDNGAEKRMNELSPWPNPRFGTAEGKQYMEFVVKTVKPYVDANLRTKPGRENTAIMGSSMGGLISHYAIHEYPQVFSKAGVFSPSYWYAKEVFEFTKTHPLPSGARSYLLMGGKEGPEATGDMLKMADLMRATGSNEAALESVIVPSGEHNEKFWRAEFPKAVLWLFGREKAAQ
jgi:predicted alpha/beta superfamily hydrolase